MACSSAAGGGHLECLKYLHDEGCPWDEVACSSAAEGGHLVCLKYLHDKGYPWDERTCLWAAAYCDIGLLKYAHENGCPWDSNTRKNVGVALVGDEVCSDDENEKDEVLKYLNDHGCPKEGEDSPRGDWNIEIDWGF